MGSWGTPVQENPAPAQAAAWGTPVDESGGPAAQPAEAPAPGWRDSIMASINDPSNVPDTGWRGQVEQFGQSAAKNIIGTALHPIVAARAAMLGGSPANSPVEMQSQLQGDVDSVKDAVQHPAQAAGSLAGGLALGGVMGAGGDMVAAARNLRPKPSAAVVDPTETAARQLTNAVNPAPQRASSYIQAAQKEVPNVIDYAKRTNNPLNTQIEFAKAAEGNAAEARSHYEDNILGPNADQSVAAPEGYGGKSYTPSGENPQTTATLGDIDDRVVQINKELSGPSAKLNEADQRAALASKTALQAEAGQLTDILHRSLADLTGLQPEDIANLRQRVGRSYELAKDTNAAVTSRGLQEGKPTATAVPHGLGVGDLAVRAAETLRGGPTAIADRAFQRAIQNFPGQAEPLPQPRPSVTPKPAPPPGTYPGQAPGSAPLPQEALPLSDANYATRGTRLQQRLNQAVDSQPASAAGEKTLNGRAYQFDTKSGWWIPVQ